MPTKGRPYCEALSPLLVQVVVCLELLVFTSLLCFFDYYRLEWCSEHLLEANHLIKRIYKTGFLANLSSVSQETKPENAHGFHGNTVGRQIAFELFGPGRLIQLRYKGDVLQLGKPFGPGLFLWRFSYADPSRKFRLERTLQTPRRRLFRVHTCTDGLRPLAE